MVQMARARACAVVVLSFLSGCIAIRTNHNVRPDAIEKDLRDPVVGVTMKDGRDIKFDGPAAHRRSHSINGRVSGQPMTIYLKDVEYFWIERESPVLAGLETAGYVLAVMAWLAIQFLPIWGRAVS